MLRARAEELEELLAELQGDYSNVEQALLESQVSYGDLVKAKKTEERHLCTKIGEQAKAIKGLNSRISGLKGAGTKAKNRIEKLLEKQKLIDQATALHDCPDSDEDFDLLPDGVCVRALSFQTHECGVGHAQYLLGVG